MTAPQVRERGIVFSGPMVRAILAGRKTQTRRVMHNQPRWCSSNQGGYWWYGHPKNGPGDAVVDWSVVLDDAHLRVIGTKGRGWGAHAGCPHGVPGDRLWVRETWAAGGLASPDDRTPAYAVDADPDVRRRIRWRPAILMPRWASRITLEITNVRVERAQAISAADVAAEGIDTAAVQTLYRDATPKQRRELGTTLATGAPSLNWRAAWTLINGRASWDANPWVWVVEFKVVTP